LAVPSAAAEAGPIRAARSSSGFSIPVTSQAAAAPAKPAISDATSARMNKAL